MKQVHKKVWTSKGRKAIIKAVKEFIVSLVELLKEGMKYMWQCPATKMLVVMVGMIAVMLIMNIAFMAAGFVVIPLIIKYAGMIMGLYFSFTYLKNKVVSLKNNVVSLYQSLKKPRDDVDNVAFVQISTEGTKSTTTTACRGT
jgi:hypothetical protein